VLSAKYGLIGGLTYIENYDHLMTKTRASELSQSINDTLAEWSTTHSRVNFVLGKTYAGALNKQLLTKHYSRRHRVVPGGIGEKLGSLHRLLRRTGKTKRVAPTLERRQSRMMYVLPDWDDFIDPNYDYTTDTFSAELRSERNERHSVSLMRPQRICDGVLVSLAQNMGSKGLLRRVEAASVNSLAPKSIKRHFGMSEDQIAFGDCGAFSYVGEDKPTITVQQAVAVYDLYGFDIGASVDHIPVASVPSKDGTRTLSMYERRKRLKITRENAASFIEEHKSRSASFIPLGVIQGLESVSYANQLGNYLEMGYQHIALGGLVPRTDNDIAEIVRRIAKKRDELSVDPWIHLFGVFRPKLQKLFRELRINSFDSATYFRKAWLRSDQNYLGVDGQWYAAIRLRPLYDPRNQLLAKQSWRSLKTIERLESAARDAIALNKFSKTSVESTVEAIRAYDRALTPSATVDERLYDAYARTLASRIWTKCDCRACKKLGVHVVLFRGKNRNKSRGAHNTLMLYRIVRNKELRSK
jgi:hypothetical protein